MTLPLFIHSFNAIYLFICLFIYLFIYLLICLFIIYLSIAIALQPKPNRCWDSIRTRCEVHLMATYLNGKAQKEIIKITKLRDIKIIINRFVLFSVTEKI